MTVDDGSEEYEVEGIMRAEWRGKVWKKLWYLVDWVGYGPEHR
jgi:hypothetical protein